MPILCVCTEERTEDAPRTASPPTVIIDVTEEEDTEDPATCSIVPGREVTIEIQKGKTGLGLSIVGGSDTLLVGLLYTLSVCVLLYISVFKADIRLLVL